VGFLPNGSPVRANLHDLGSDGLVPKRIKHVPHSDPPKAAIKSRNSEYANYERIAEKICARRTRREGRAAAVKIQSHKDGKNSADSRPSGIAEISPRRRFPALATMPTHFDVFCLCFFGFH